MKQEALIRHPVASDFQPPKPGEVNSCCFWATQSLCSNSLSRLRQGTNFPVLALYPYTSHGAGVPVGEPQCRLQEDVGPLTRDPTGLSVKPGEANLRCRSGLCLCDIPGGRTLSQ